MPSPHLIHLNTEVKPRTMEDSKATKDLAGNGTAKAEETNEQIVEISDDDDSRYSDEITEYDQPEHT